MLLCSVDELEPGMQVGGSVIHPRRPETELLRPGVVLDERIIANLKKLGVPELWVQHDATRDLDAAVAPNLTAARAVVYNQLRRDFQRLSATTISTSQVQSYRQAIMALVCELMSSGKYAHLSHQMLVDDSGLFTHGANVAYLSLMVGLEIETYIVRQRARLTPDHARDVVPLGLGGMLHDIGKLGMDASLRAAHELRCHDPETQEMYRDHALIGYRMLENTRMPATARQAVLNHHQRFDGSGWPDYADVTGGRRCGALAGDEIHVFSRIVAAANALDNLISDGDQRRPTVAALKEFAGPRFDGRFDPVVRDLMLRRIPPFPIGSTVRLSDGRAAVVTSLSFDQPCRPTVRLLSDESASRTNDGQPITIALVQESDVHIAEYHGQPVSDYLYEVAPSQRAQPVARACA